ncbi:MAG TPA: tRNA (adenosine(37)-N6)-threonylcarbamoyltransferase complex dimerization subunit type 1 TsaB, partial [Gammaproteobacteria bacterium]|nr:tRNA (adenosine(37)-N6)-threonylcarbamoyltransferase complex dimerization subunit type 1 TsaB [Gammaproteobacteria bacterium]
QGEVYWGAFRNGPQGAEPVEEERVVAPDGVPLPGGEGPWWGIGSGWEAHGEALAARLGPALAGVDAGVPVRADAVAALALGPWREGRVLAPAEAVPTYLRASYAQPSPET